MYRVRRFELARPMTPAPLMDNDVSPAPLAAARTDWHAEAPGLLLLAPEWHINRVPLNDLVLHRAATERMAAHFARGEPFLDPWVSEWALDYPVWRSYQILPYVFGVADPKESGSRR